VARANSASDCADDAGTSAASLPAGEQLQEDQAERVDVDRLVRRAVRAFWRGVRARSDDELALERHRLALSEVGLGEAEVCDLHGAVDRDHHVCGLQIAVQHVKGLGARRRTRPRVVERRGDPVGHRQRDVDREPARAGG
jgi:hypothetical protein